MKPTEQKSSAPRPHPVRRDLRRSPLRLSPSSIAVFQQCPQQYKFRYIDKLGEQYLKPRPFFTAANHIHSTLKDFLSIETAELRTVAMAEKLLRENWSHSRIGFRDTEDEKRWFKKAQGQVEAFAISPYASGKPLMLESPVEALVSPGVMLYGRVDRVDQRPDGSIHIIDYKTGKAPAQANWMQLQLQALILNIVLPSPVSCVSFLYLEHCHMLTREVSSADLAQIRWDLLGMASQMRRERRYLPRMGAWCRGCDFAPLCSAPRPETTPSSLAGQLILWEDSTDDI